jgi:hypothetical protein
MTEDGHWFVRADFDPKERIKELESLCEGGWVVNVWSKDGATISGVLMGISMSHLVLEGWSAEEGSPNGELLVIALDTIEAIWVP